MLYKLTNSIKPKLDCITRKKISFKKLFIILFLNYKKVYNISSFLLLSRRIFTLAPLFKCWLKKPLWRAKLVQW